MDKAWIFTAVSLWDSGIICYGRITTYPDETFPFFQYYEFNSHRMAFLLNSGGTWLTPLTAVITVESWALISNCCYSKYFVHPFWKQLSGFKGPTPTDNSECFTSIILLNPGNSPEKSVLLIFIVQTRETEAQKGSGMTQDPTAKRRARIEIYVGLRHKPSCHDVLLLLYSSRVGINGLSHLPCSWEVTENILTADEEIRIKQWKWQWTEY